MVPEAPHTLATWVRATRLTLHGTRHSYVTNLLADGLDMATVSKLAGHSSVAFTVKQCHKLLDEHAAAAARLYA